MTSGHCLAHMIKWEHHKLFVMGWEGALFKSEWPWSLLALYEVLLTSGQFDHLANWLVCRCQVPRWQVSSDCIERSPSQLPSAWGVCAPAPVPAVVWGAGNTGPQLHHHQLPWGDLRGHPPAQWSRLGRWRWFITQLSLVWFCHCRHWTCLLLTGHFCCQACLMQSCYCGCQINLMPNCHCWLPNWHCCC